MTTETSRPPLEALDLAVGWAVHDLTTSITHKLATPTTLDEDCAVFGQAIVGRLAAAGLTGPLVDVDLLTKAMYAAINGHRRWDDESVETQARRIADEYPQGTSS